MSAWHSFRPGDDGGTDRPREFDPSRQPSDPWDQAVGGGIAARAGQGMYAQIGRPSFPPEHLLKSGPLMAMYSICSERRFCERLRYDLLLEWLLGPNVEGEPFDHYSFARTAGGCRSSW